MPSALQFSGFFQLLFYANPTWIDYGLILAGTLCAIGAGVPFPLMGILYGNLVDNMNDATCEATSSGTADSYRDANNKKVLQLVYLGIGAFFLVYGYLLFWSLQSQRLSQRIQDKYFSVLLRQDAEFFDKRHAGEISSRLSGAIQAIQTGTSEKVGIFLSSISFLITAYVVGFIEYTKLTGMLIYLIPTMLFSSLICGYLTQKYGSQMSDAIDAASSIASEALNHVAVVHAFSAERPLGMKFTGHMSKARTWGIKKSVYIGAQSGFLYFLAFSANALAFWQGTKAIAAAHQQTGEAVTVGAIYTVVLLVVDGEFLSNPCTMIGQVAPLLPIFGTATTSFLKLKKDMEIQPQIGSSENKGERLQHGIEARVNFANVTFSYPSRPDVKVLENVTFACPARSHTAIVGLSGSGKSTLAGLLCRLYDPADGRVLLAGHSISSLDVVNLRGFMSLVPQEPSLFDMSILENIALGLSNALKPELKELGQALLGPDLARVAHDLRHGSSFDMASDAYGSAISKIAQLVMEAAEMADVMTFVHRQEFGFGTVVGQSGKLVSGGQRQRIALARALIKDPSVLILDEATAALDSASEKRVQDAIDRVAEGRTVITIAHRLSTIKNADSIVVMKDGGVLEQGNHTDLLAMGGQYARLVKLQNLSTESSAPRHARGSIDSHISYESSAVETLYTDTASEKDVAIKKPVTPAQAVPHQTADAAAKWTILRLRARILRPYLLWLTVAIVAAFIVGCTYSASGVIFGNTIGIASPCTPPTTISSRGGFLALMYLALALAEGAANLASWSAFGYVAESLVYLTRANIFQSLFKQPLSWHETGDREPSTLLSLITKDAAALGSLSGSIIGTIMAVIVNVVVSIVLSHIIAWKIAVVCVAICPIFLAAGWMQLRTLSNFEKKHANAYAQAIGVAVASVNSIKTIAALSIEDVTMESYKRILKGPNRDVMKASTLANLWLALGFSTGNFLYSFTYWWGSSLIIKGEYSQTQFLIVLVAILVGAQMWGQLLVLIPEVSRAWSAARRIFNILDFKDSWNDSFKSLDAANKKSRSVDVEPLVESKPTVNASNRGTSIKFKDIGFAYPGRPDITVLRDINFEVKPGQFCGLVGPSGSGKSTILRLIQRLYDPSGGVIELDGKAITGSDNHEFRDCISLVPQDCALFDGSVRFNISLGARRNQMVEDQDIEEACRFANIHDTIMSLPNGYDTECGANGTHFSGGQRQRIAIARALVRKPQLLLLDESSSALDAESETALQNSLRRAAEKTTVIAIAHRLQTVKMADVIFVVDEGNIVAKGRHEELVEISETYRQNALHQMIGR
ncbi:putative Leptomycin B resistance protein pmd1 [Seiridium cardinale]|uniref:Leptomycin B resistance protein pmd1 n=1 Tax=Seiridium cardinale TaxID=138064 RepID=A0ABR2Y0Y2_9PEZI